MQLDIEPVRGSGNYTVFCVSTHFIRRYLNLAPSGLIVDCLLQVANSRRALYPVVLRLNHQ